MGLNIYYEIEKVALWELDFTSNCCYPQKHCKNVPQDIVWDGGQEHTWRSTVSLI